MRHQHGFAISIGLNGLRGITPVNTSKIWALVLAGGEGSRLRSLTVTPDGIVVPKQFCSLQGGASLLEQTQWRAEAVTERQRTLTVVAAQHQRWWKEQLRSAARENIIVQSENRGTSAGLLLPLLHIAQRDPKATVFVLPSDHYVRSETVLARALQQAVRLARIDHQHVYLLGYAPEEIDPELGYIVSADRASFIPAGVQQFVEKPSVEIARRLVEFGALWNAFILAASATVLLKLFAERYPSLVERMTRAVIRDASCPQDAPAATALYAELPTLDFSRDVLEGQESLLRVLAVPACGWSDLGTPRRVAETLSRIARPSEPAENAITTAYLSLATQHSRQNHSTL
jgi:mannose-1-phosphate guanylyltransferase